MQTKYLITLLVLTSNLLMAYQRLNEDIYARGFLYSTEDPKVLPAHYVPVTSQLWVDPRLEFSISPHKNVIIFGLAVDIRDPKIEIHHIAKNLEKKLLKDIQLFYHEEEYLSGRYAIIYWVKNGELFILSDASSLRSIFHSKDGNIIAGHAKLVADNLEGKNVKPITSRPIWGERNSFPARGTPYTNVLQLIPNTSLSISKNRIVRFFPRKKISIRQPKSQIETLEKWLANSLKAIEIRSRKKNLKLLVSITAGLDSRTTLAMILKHLNSQIRCFTYEAIPKDRLAIDICNALNLDHIFVENSLPLERELKEVMNINTFYEHDQNFNNQNRYLDYFGRDQYIQIRSNCAEIGRGFFLPYCFKYNITNTCDSTELIKIFSPSYGHKFMSKLERKNAGINLLNDYLHATKLRPFTLRGYDIRELFHWELHAGIRHSQILILEDILFESFVPHNARKIYDLMLRLPLKDKLNGTLQKKLIMRNYPDLSAWPINPEMK